MEQGKIRKRSITNKDIKKSKGGLYIEETLYSLWNKSAGPFFYHDEDEKPKRIDPKSVREDITEFELKQIKVCSAFKDGLVCLVDPGFEPPANQFTEESIAALVEKYRETKDEIPMKNFIGTLSSRFACEDFISRIKGYPDLPMYFENLAQTRISEIEMHTYNRMS